MFDIGFSEIVLIFGLALVVLGPEKLPKLAATIGRWVGRARAMARQFQDQLETETESLKSSVSDIKTNVESSFSDLKTSVDDAQQQVSTIAQQAGDATQLNPDARPPSAPPMPPPDDDTKHHERGI
jgi:sec-independent protein translocase protein TatB